MAVRGARPTATSTFSASFTTCLPSALVKVTFTPSLVFSTFSTLAPVWVSMPRLRKTRASSLLTSSSSLGTRRGRYSTMVISLPKLLKMEPNSTPTAPAPITTMDLGICGSARISMLVRMRFASDSTPGSMRASEPVATTTFFAWTTFFSPLAASTEME